METISLNFKGKNISLKARECRGVMKAIGLMFSGENADARIFRFSKPTKTPIHSYFCPEFIAIWLRDSKVVDFKIVNSKKLSISPKQKFDTLLEIPLNKKYKDTIAKLNIVDRKV